MQGFCSVRVSLTDGLEICPLETENLYNQYHVIMYTIHSNPVSCFRFEKNFWIWEEWCRNCLPKRSLWPLRLTGSNLLMAIWVMPFKRRWSLQEGTCLDYSLVPVLQVFCPSRVARNLDTCNDSAWVFVWASWFMMGKPLEKAVFLKSSLWLSQGLSVLRSLIAECEANDVPQTARCAIATEVFRKAQLTGMFYCFQLSIGWGHFPLICRPCIFVHWICFILMRSIAWNFGRWRLETVQHTWRRSGRSFHCQSKCSGWSLIDFDRTFSRFGTALGRLGYT